jgi:hypothetical protein
VGGGVQVGGEVGLKGVVVDGVEEESGILGVKGASEIGS